MKGIVFFDSLIRDYLRLKKLLRKKKKGVDRDVEFLIKSLNKIDGVYTLFSCSGHVGEPISTYIDFISLSDDFYEYIKEGIKTLPLNFEWQLERRKDGTISLRIKNTEIATKETLKKIKEDLEMWKKYVEKFRKKKAFPWFVTKNKVPIDLRLEEMNPFERRDFLKDFLTGKISVNGQKVEDLDEKGVEMLWRIYNNPKICPYKVSSIIDYPYETLPKDLWYEEDGTYKLKPEVRKEIIRIVKEVLDKHFVSPEKWLKGILIVSSAATQFYLPEIDLDVKIVVDFDKLLKEEELDVSDLEQNTIRKAILERIREDKYKIGVHDVDFYVIDLSEVPSYTGKKADSAYDVLADEWIKQPHIVDVDKYDREKVISRAKDDALKWAKEWDLDLGEIKRSLVEYEAIKEHLRILPPEEKEKFREEIQKILVDLENEIREMYEEMGELVKERHESFRVPFTPNVEEYYFSLNWAPANIKFKLLQRWGYLKLISDLGELLEDDKITEEEIEDVERAVRGEVEKIQPIEQIEKTLEALKKQIEILKGKKVKRETLEGLKKKREFLKLLINNLEEGPVKTKFEKVLKEVEKKITELEKREENEHPFKGKIIDVRASKKKLKELMKKDPLLVESIIGSADVFFPVQYPTKEKVERFVDSMTEEQAKEVYDYVSRMMRTKRARRPFEAFWIDPNGRVFSLKNETHTEWIKRNIELLPKEIQEKLRSFVGSPDDWERLLFGASTELLDSGWIRITCAGSFFAVALESLTNLDVVEEVFLPLKKYKYLVMEIYEPESNSPKKVLELERKDVEEMGLKEAVEYYSKFKKADKTLLDNEWLKIKETDDKYVYIDNKEGVAILPFRKVDDKREFLVRKEENPLFDNYITVITGRRDKEDKGEGWWLETAKRELEEEAGIKVEDDSRFIPLGGMIISKDHKNPDFLVAVDVTELEEKEPKTDGTKYEKLSENYWIDEDSLKNYIVNYPDSYLATIGSKFLLLDERTKEGSQKPKVEFKTLIVYHITDRERAEELLSNNFDLSQSPEDWWGQGIWVSSEPLLSYFEDDDIVFKLKVTGNVLDVFDETNKDIEELQPDFYDDRKRYEFLDRFDVDIVIADREHWFVRRGASITVLDYSSVGDYKRAKKSYIDVDELLWRGVSEDKLQEILEVGKLQPSTVPIPEDNEVVEYLEEKGWTYDDIISEIPWDWKRNPNGVNLTTFENAKGYGDYVVGVECDSFADFGEYFLARPEDCRIKVIYDVKRDEFFEPKKSKKSYVDPIKLKRIYETQAKGLEPDLEDLLDVATELYFQYQKFVETFTEREEPVIGDLVKRYEELFHALREEDPKKLMIAIDNAINQVHIDLPVLLHLYMSISKDIENKYWDEQKGDFVIPEEEVRKEIKEREEQFHEFLRFFEDLLKKQGKEIPKGLKRVSQFIGEWIDPEGNVFKVRDHFEWIVENPEKVKKYVNLEKSWDFQELIEALIKEGWVRTEFVLTKFGKEFDATIKNESFLKPLEDHILENNYLERFDSFVVETLEPRTFVRLNPIEINEIGLREAFEYSKLTKVAAYPKHPETVVIEPNRWYKKGVTEKMIYEYYDSIKHKMIPFMKGKDIMLFIKTDGTVIKRKNSGGKPIRINNEKDFEKHLSGRTIEWHITYGKRTDKYVVDLDPHEEFKNFEKVKDYAARVGRLLKRQPEVTKVTYRFSGNRGIYVEAQLKGKMDIDRARKKLKELLDEEFKDDLNVTTKLARPDQMRLDVSTFHYKGSIKAPYSLSGKTGLASIPIKDLKGFKKEHARIDRVLKKASLWERFIRRAQTDRDIILQEYRKGKQEGKTDEEIIESIVDILLPIGFDRDYWRRKVKEVLKKASTSSESEFYRLLNERAKKGFINITHETFMENVSKILKEGIRGYVFGTVGHHYKQQFVTSPNVAIIHLEIPKEFVQFFTPDMRYDPDDSFGDLLRQHPDLTGADLSLNLEYIPPEWIVRIVDGNGEVVYQRGQRYSEASSKLKPVHLMRLVRVNNIEDVPVDHQYVCEYKYDGFLTSVIVEDNVELWTRNGKREFSEKFPEIVKELKNIPKGTYLLGETTWIEGNKQHEEIISSIVGTKDIEEVEKKKKEHRGKSVLYLFDILWYKGEPVYNEPLKERRKLLERVVKEGSYVKLTKQFPFSQWRKRFQEALKIGGEGLVFKNLDEKYYIGKEKELRPSGVWCKYKKGKEIEDVDCYTDKYVEGKEGKLIFICYQLDKGKPKEISRVSGISQERAKKWKEMIDKGKKVVITIGGQEWTPVGKLRHPRFIKEHFDKPWKSCVYTGPK